MNTYLPFADYAKTAEVLDDKRLNRQRADVVAILKALSEPPPEDGEEHNAVRMWRGNEKSLIKYGLIICWEWASRGNADATAAKINEFRDVFAEGSPDDPEWLGDEEVHAAHRSHLLRLRPSHYRDFFDVSDDLPMVWPRKPKKEEPSIEMKFAMRARKRYLKAELTYLEVQKEFIEACLDADVNRELQPLDDEDRSAMEGILAAIDQALHPAEPEEVVEESQEVTE